jgi:hypothetical protein
MAITYFLYTVQFSCFKQLYLAMYVLVALITWLFIAVQSAVLLNSAIYWLFYTAIYQLFTAIGMAMILLRGEGGMSANQAYIVPLAA